MKTNFSYVTNLRPVSKTFNLFHFELIWLENFFTIRWKIYNIWITRIFTKTHTLIKCDTVPSVPWTCRRNNTKNIQSTKMCQSSPKVLCRKKWRKNSEGISQLKSNWKHKHPFNSLFSRTIWVSRHQKGSTNLHCVSKKGYHPTTNDNFNNRCRIPVIFGTNITE